MKTYRQNKTVELPTGVKVRHQWDKKKKTYILTVASPQKQ